jgi:hypothetical protein
VIVTGVRDTRLSLSWEKKSVPLAADRSDFFSCQINSIFFLGHQKP